MTDTGSDADPSTSETSVESELETLRAAVEEKYDFDDFGPADMAKMSAEEWNAAFETDSWVTGIELLDRVEDELKNRIARREVFAVVERGSSNDQEFVLAYSDEGYAVVFADGSLEGEGTVFRDVKPTVVLCSMPEFEVSEPPAEYGLPAPEDVPISSGEFGNTILQIIAVAQLLAGIALLGTYLLVDTLTTIVAPIAGVAFLLAGVFLLVIVANARLSDRFRTREYRERLRAVQFDDGERPSFVPNFTDGVPRSDDAQPVMNESEGRTIENPTEIPTTENENEVQTTENENEVQTTENVKKVQTNEDENAAQTTENDVTITEE